MGLYLLGVIPKAYAGGDRMEEASWGLMIARWL